MAKKLEPKGVVYFIRMVMAPFIYALIYYLAAGRMDSPRVWTYFIIAFVYYLSSVIVMYIKSPEILNERGKRKKDAKSWDKVLVLIFGITSLSPLVLAGLDARYGWSELSMAWMISGIIILVLGSVLATWSMIVNRHFEVNIRIQSDRDHQVVSTGPYRFIRHPGYSAGILWVLSIPMILGSSIAFIGAGTCLVVVIIRTALEDRTLRSELTGYSEYAAKVRFRLIPGIW